MGPEIKAGSRENVMGLKFLFVLCLTLGLQFGGLLTISGYGQGVGDGLSQQEAGQVVENVVMPYFLALQKGDVRSVEQRIGGNLSMTLGRLLNENPEYANFLRERYEKMQLIDSPSVLRRKAMDGFSKIDEVQGRGNIILNLQQSDGRPLFLQLSAETDGDGQWKIVDQKIVADQ